MAESDKVKATDIIEENVFEPTIEEGKELLVVLKAIEDEFKNILSVTGKKISLVTPKTVADVEDLNDSLKKVDDTEKSLLETQKRKETLKARLIELQKKEAIELQKISEQIKEQNKANKEQAREQLGLVTAYQKASKELNELRNAYKNLAVAGRENGVVGRGLLQTITEQDTKLKGLDATVGQHQRNVGNYTGAMKGLGGVLINTAKLLGFNEEAIHSLEEGYKKSLKILKGFKQTKESFSQTLSKENSDLGQNVQVTNEGTEAVKKATIAQRIMNTVRSLGVVGIGAIIAAGALLVSGIIAIVGAVRDHNKAEEERQRALDGTIIKSDELRAEHNEHILVMKELDIEYRKTTGSISEFQAQIEQLNVDYLRVITSIRDETKKKLDEANTITKTFFEKLKDAITFSGTDPLGDMKKDVDILIEQGNKETMAFEENEERKKIAEADRLQKIADLEAQKFKDLRKLQAESIKDETQRRIALLKLQAEFDVDDIHKLEIDEGLKAALIIAINKKLLADLEAINEIARKKREKEILEELEFRKKVEEDYFAHIQKILKEIEEEEKKAREKNKQDSEQLRKDLSDARKKEVTDGQKEREKNEFDANQKRIDNLIKQEELYTKAIFDGLDRRNQKKQEQIDKELEQINDSIKHQQELADRGLANTLAFEEKRRAEALAKKIELEKKARKQEQAQQLANVFLEFLKSYAKEGSIGAPAKALAQTLIAKGISDVIAGNFAKGVENMDGKGTATSDSNLALLSKGESVVTAAGTKRDPGLATAMNQGNVMDYFKDNYLPQYHQQLHSDKSRRSQVDGAMLALLDQKLTDLQKTIQHKKETSINWDGHGNMVREEVEHGIRKHITRQRRSF